MFPLLKLLTFLPFGSFLRGGSLKIVAVGVLVAVAAFGYWKWKDTIEDRVRDDVNSQLLEERLAEQKKQTELLLALNAKQNEAIKLAISRNEDLLKAIDQGRISIAGLEASPATQPLEEALRVIRELETKEAPAPAKKSGNVVIDAWNKITGGSE